MIYYVKEDFQKAWDDANNAKKLGAAVDEEVLAEFKSAAGK
jgi:hypothetical protein